MRWFRWSVSICVACVACLFTTSNAWAGAIVDGPHVRVSDAALNDADVDNVRMVEQNGTLYAVWSDERDVGIDPSVYIAKSTNGGVSWGPNTRVSQLAYDIWTNYPDIAVQPDGTIWVIWHLYYANDSTKVNDIRIAKSTDGGATFTVNNLANGNDDDSDLWHSRIVADASNGGLYVITHLYGVSGEDEGGDFVLLRYWGYSPHRQ